MNNAAVSPRHICFLRLSAVGDVCHMVAIVQMVQRTWPEAKITWVIGRLEASLLAGLPGVEFIVFDKRAGLTAYYGLYRQLRDRRFDILVHAQVAFRASLVSLCLRAKRRIGFDRKRAKDLQWLFTRERIAPQEAPHVIEGFRAFAEYLGVTDTALTWDVPIAPEELSWARTVIQKPRVLIIHPASSVSYRNWTTQGYAQVARHAVMQHEMQVIITGGLSALEKDIAHDIAKACDGHVTNIVSQTTLTQLLALISQATVVLAPDTGPAHMATMVDTPVIGLYACTNPQRAAAYKSQRYVVSAYPEACQQFLGHPKAALPFGQRVKTADAMALIPASDVIAMLDTLLAEMAIPEESMAHGT